MTNQTRCTPSKSDSQGCGAPSALATSKKGRCHCRLKHIPAGFICTVLVLVLAIVCLGIGRLHINPVDVISILSNRLFGTNTACSQAAISVVGDIRLPRIVMAILIGGALAISGATYQGMFRNPMVSPDILGASAGAGFGAALALLMNGDARMVQLVAFIMGFIAVLITCLATRSLGRTANRILLLVLCGLIVGTLFQAFISVIKYTADPDSKLPEITYWLMGSISKVTWDDIGVFIPLCIIGTVPLLLLRWRLNTLSFGDMEAESLGVNVKRLRAVYIVCATLLTSSVVAVAGIIGWIGLIIPHLVRFIFGPDHRIVLPMSFVLGAGFLILVDTLCRTLLPSEIPLGILTSIVGAPFFFIILLRTQRRSNS